MNIQLNFPKASFYKVNKGFDLQDVMDETNRDIRAGWAPVGGMTSYKDHNNANVFLQSVVLYQDR